MMKREEIGEILHKAGESIVGAEALLTKNLSGFAASRAYYAMFYAAEALLANRGLSFSKHSAVIAAFGQHFAKPRVLDAKFHEYLMEASEKRQIGDYAFGDEVKPEDARRQIERAQEFLEAAKKLLQR